VSQLVDEGRQFGDLVLGVDQLRRHQLVEASLHGAASLAVPDIDEIGDLFQRAAELLGSRDERQAGERHLVVEPVSGVSARGRYDQADAFVVAQGGRGEASAAGDLTDRVGGHDPTVKVQSGLKVKSKPCAYAAMGSR
jgi:hypothetical protein